MIKEALEKLAYAVFPKRCELCGEVVALDEVRCEECKNLLRIEGELCFSCGNPKDECSCVKRQKKPEYKRFIAPYYYENSISAGVNRFKNFGYPELSKTMGKEIFEHINEYYNNIEFDCITFVPMTKSKQEKRGYNQSELLANEVSKNMNIPSVALIEKIMKTPEQKKGSAKDRRMNLHGVFDLKDNADADGKTILLIDDIKTTGSTLNECAYVLNAYGAKAVYTASFCMTKNKKSKKSETNEQK